MHRLETQGLSPASATGLSADGTVAAGIVLGSSPRPYRATRWDAAGTLLDLSYEAGNSQGIGVSGDGLTVVGWSEIHVGQSPVRKPFLWTESGGVRHLNIPGGVAYAASYDGSRVAGYDFNGYQHAFVWDEQVGVTWLGTLGGNQSAATGISADGRVAVGWANNPAGQARAFRWTQDEGMQDLGTLGGSDAYAYGASQDGSVIVGTAKDASGQWMAFRWEAGQMQAIGPARSVAYGVSSDGTVAVGEYESGPLGNHKAMRWTATSNWIDMGTLGSENASAWALSADGSVVVGRSRDATHRDLAFRWVGEPTPADYDGDLYLQITDLLNFLDDFGSCLNQATPCGQFGNPDINADGTIDVLDLLDYLDAYARGC